MAQKIDPSVCHPDYCELERKYDVCSDAFSGDVCEYIPKLDDMSDDEYKAYVTGASFYNVVDRTVQAAIGAMMRKPYTLDGAQAFPNTDYKSPEAFLQASIRDLLLGARVAILVDVDASGRSKLIPYNACDIINWSDSFRIIKETSLQPDPTNPYAQVAVDSWLELYLDENGEYQSRRWTQNRRGVFVADELDQMKVNGVALKEIPLFISTPYDNTWDVYTPPLFTQATKNIEHFRKSVDLSHYGHHMALPSLTIVGDLFSYDDAKGNTVTAPLKIGSTKQAIHLTTGSTASYTEVSGNSFKMLQGYLSDIQEQMYLAGSRLLTTKNGVESAAALQIRSGSESAVLETITNSLESALNQAFVLTSLIDRGTTATGVTLNKDFSSAVEDPQMVAQLLALYTADVITLEQFTARLIEGEVVTPEEINSKGTTNGVKTKDQVDEDEGMKINSSMSSNPTQNT